MSIFLLNKRTLVSSNKKLLRAVTLMPIIPVIIIYVLILTTIYYLITYFRRRFQISYLGLCHIHLLILLCKCNIIFIRFFSPYKIVVKIFKLKPRKISILLTIKKLILIFWLRKQLKKCELFFLYT